VDLPDRRVREEICERRTAFFGTLDGVVTRAVDVREGRKLKRRATSRENGGCLPHRIVFGIWIESRKETR
jgi:hypothetical protein